MTVLKMIGLAVLFALSGQAGAVNLGLISYDTLIPGAPGSPGVTDFSINVFTGDPALGGFALPPDFPVFGDVILQNSRLVLSSAGPSLTFNLGDLAPGSYNPVALQFPDTGVFTSAVFTATLNSPVLNLSDGSTITLGSSALTATLFPASGKSLKADTDFVLISGTSSSVPEPGSGALMTAVAAALALQRRRRQ